MFQDLRHAARMLLHAKGWTAVVLVSLALGIGANTALFTAVNGLLIRQLPVPHPETLVRLRWAGKNQVQRSSSDYGFNGKTAAGENIRATVSNALYQAMRAAGQSSGALTDLAASAPIGSVNILLNGSADLSSTLLVSGNYFQVMQVSPFLGRLISPEDDQPSAPAVAVLSYAVWTRRFGSDPNVVNRVVNMNNVPVTIVGVTPESFTGTQNLGASGRDITLPLSLDPQFGGEKRLSEPTNWWLQTMGRLKPGATLDQVRASLGTVFQNTAKDGLGLVLRVDYAGTADARDATRIARRCRISRSTPAARGIVRPGHQHDALGDLRSRSSRASCCSSSARTSRTCCCRARPSGRGKSPCASRWARRARGSSGSC